MKRTAESDSGMSVTCGWVAAAAVGYHIIARLTRVKRIERVGPRSSSLQDSELCDRHSEKTTRKVVIDRRAFTASS